MKQSISVQLEMTDIEFIDEVRGQTPRAKYIRKVVESHIEEIENRGEEITDALDGLESLIIENPSETHSNHIGDVSTGTVTDNGDVQSSYTG